WCLGIVHDADKILWRVRAARRWLVPWTRIPTPSVLRDSAVAYIALRRRYEQPTCRARTGGRSSRGGATCASCDVRKSGREPCVVLPGVQSHDARLNPVVHEAGRRF